MCCYCIVLYVIHFCSIVSHCIVSQLNMSSFPNVFSPFEKKSSLAYCSMSFFFDSLGTSTLSVPPLLRFLTCLPSWIHPNSTFLVVHNISAQLIIPSSLLFHSLDDVPPKKKMALDQMFGDFLTRAPVKTTRERAKEEIIERVQREGLFRSEWLMCCSGRNNKWIFHCFQHCQIATCPSQQQVYPLKECFAQLLT